MTVRDDTPPVDVGVRGEEGGGVGGRREEESEGVERRVRQNEGGRREE